MQNFIEKLTNNLVVAAFVPSVIFCTAIILIFQEQLSSVTMVNIITIYKEIGLFVLFSAFTVSLFLVYLRELVFEAYRGRYFPSYFSIVEQNRARNTKRQIQKIRDAITTLENGEGQEHEISLLRDELYRIVSDYHMSYPLSEKVASTRLGNILAAADDCIVKRYKLDPVPLWSRLIQLLPLSNYQKIDDAFNQMSLLINSSLLSFLLFIVSLVAFLDYHHVYGIWQESYITVAVIAFFFFYIFYLASLPIAKSYTRMYCSAFDLYRFEILKQMKLELPADSVEESIIWQKVSELLAIGTEFGPLYFEYTHSDNQTGKST